MEEGYNMHVMTTAKDHHREVIATCVSEFLTVSDIKKTISSRACLCINGTL